ncbi:hypothetical protein TEHD10_2234 [Tetragenococcus halophilus subsp. halophilus]|uniref:Uncharacterized protein n=1 Tax=Ligilactobacillus pobuzihii TaxID=449659 RepID=A0A0R2LMK6_9LACO|nr:MULTISPECIES: hypothetical protein [Lactobacillales]KRK09414.1 hypothetical protein FD11_GL000958 [Ligilactobacillus pobuzihii E100301 = KCTC 13174]KRO02567.1 hypothetical protein IV66_GL001162 [Ligilactobacillus pobuzihii]GBD81171.1 hypothetical protein TEHD10_2234 [Tetragenococcus halophilus subsp. halophilus]GEN49003.1 hypothetical protein LPO01_17950 [Ligilactobacillus pobuzihii]
MDLKNKLATAKLETEKLAKIISKAESSDAESVDVQDLDRILLFTLIIYGICNNDLYQKKDKLKISEKDLEKMNAFYFAYNKAKHTTVFKIEEKDLSYGSIVGNAVVGKAQLGKTFGIVWAKLKKTRAKDREKYAAYKKYLEGQKILDTISMGIDLIKQYYPKLIEIYK